MTIRYWKRWRGAPCLSGSVILIPVPIRRMCHTGPRPCSVDIAVKGYHGAGELLTTRVRLSHVGFVFLLESLVNQVVFSRLFLKLFQFAIPSLVKVELGCQQGN